MKNTTSVISLEKVGPAEYKVLYENGIQIGEFLMKEDGYFDFWPKLGGGYWPSYLLRELANQFDILNQPIEDEIQNYFNKQKEVEEENG